MDDLLQRMLAIDQEAEKLIEAAELDAAKILEETRLQIADKHEQAQADLVAESDKLLRERIEKCQQGCDAELEQADLGLAARQEAFAERISGKRAELLRILLRSS
jgi:hypothetical protein